MSIPTPEAVFALLRDRPGAAWLDGGTSGHGWSVIAFDPVEVCTDSAHWPQTGRRMTEVGPPSDAPFSGGCLGYIGYGAGNQVAFVPPEPSAWEPNIRFGKYLGGMCFRHTDRSWQLAGTPEFQTQASRLLDRARPLAPPPPPPMRVPRTIPQHEYQQAVSHILTLLNEGDCYQVNLSRAVFIDDPGDPWAAYRRLRALSSASYSAFLRLEDAVVLSNSPELFLEVNGQNVRTGPVKGTRPRGTDSATDAQLAQELLLSRKDQAELTMIVDLYRNDLGRIALPGTVRTGPRTVVSHANVHHTVQIIEAEMLTDKDCWDVLAASFPPGSVTGAPKVRACQRIRELETHPRGVYCGAIGAVSSGGHSTWSVAIHTAVFHGRHARYHVGGGIVVDSDPAAEWWETEHKGSALSRALCRDGGDQ